MKYTKEIQDDLYEACKLAKDFIEMCAFEESQTKCLQILNKVLTTAKKR